MPSPLLMTTLLRSQLDPDGSRALTCGARPVDNKQSVNFTKNMVIYSLPYCFFLNLLEVRLTE